MNMSWVFALQEVVGGDERSPLFLVLPEPTELIWGAVSFIIVVVLVGRRAMPAINKTLEARQQAITGRLEEAEQAKTEAQTLLDDYRKQIANVRAEGNQILEGSRQSAETVKQDILARAGADAEQIVARAREEAAAERARALADAHQEVANLSIDLAERVVGQNLDRETQLGLVERYLAELERI
ncbi:MAG TPA: F0F1 ATP synthase subunit B [Acidimicrobiia bacterium]|nr:F0F1 ATP synthase subunit B [Acidimicrobiia bacterium]